jgi:hypothetical protein
MTDTGLIMWVNELAAVAAGDLAMTVIARVSEAIPNLQF